jgi:hypothetical protein
MKEKAKRVKTGALGEREFTDGELDKMMKDLPLKAAGAIARMDFVLGRKKMIKLVRTPLLSDWMPAMPIHISVSRTHLPCVPTIFTSSLFQRSTTKES